jgi:hypothetical protein
MGVWGFPYPWPLQAKATLERWWRRLQTLQAKNLKLIQNSLSPTSNKKKQHEGHTHTHQDLRHKGTMGIWGIPYPWPLEQRQL